MSEQRPKTIALRRLEPGESRTKQDYWVEPWDKTAGFWCAEVSPIPEGFEVCDLADATKVWIGDGFRDVENYCIDSDPVKDENYPIVLDIRRLNGLGILAIRPITEPEPMRGESEIFVDERTTRYGIAGGFPASLIGKRIRWEVVQDGGE